MFANDFEYYQAESADEAVELLAAHDGAELVAGAHGLLPRMRTGEEAPPVLVDISDADGLANVDETDDGLSVGALATHAELAAAEPVRRRASALADAAGEVGDLQVRNGGTIGGNLAHGDGRADLPAAVLALEGSLTVHGPDGERTIDDDDCFLGHFETAVADDELVTAVRIPAAEDDAGHTERVPQASESALRLRAGRGRGSASNRRRVDPGGSRRRDRCDHAPEAVAGRRGRA